MEEIKIISDSIKFRGPSIDGSYSLTFVVGEYQKHLVAELIRKHDLNSNLELKVKDIDD